MLGRSHLTTGVTTAAWTAYALPLDPSIAVMVGVVGAFAALVPDLDHVGSTASRSTPDAKYLSWLVRRTGGHRTVTHDARIGPPVAAAVTGLGVVFIAGPIGAAWWAFALAMLIGCLTHIWGDSRTNSGVPLGSRRIRIGRTFSTGSPHETRLRRLVYQPVAIGSLLAVGWLTHTAG